jgi:serine/threonine protein kinase
MKQVYTTKNNTYIITELCQTDLSKKIKSNLNEKEVYHYMNQIISGYMEFQSRDIIHRDLKPANLLITNEN